MSTNTPSATGPPAPARAPAWHAARVSALVLVLGVATPIAAVPMEAPWRWPQRIALVEEETRTGSCNGMATSGDRLRSLRCPLRA